MLNTHVPLLRGMKAELTFNKRNQGSGGVKLSVFLVMAKFCKTYERHPEKYLLIILR